MIRGFTLVELAIVMTIVGLLIGGVLKGQELLENSRMTSLGSQLKSYEAAITTFRDIYKGIPGDHNNATNIIKGCTAANNCANGDGSGIINGTGFWYEGYDTVEAFQAWKHLVLADLIKGVDPSIARVAASYRGASHVPASPFGGQMYIKTASGNCTSVDQFLCGISVFASAHTNGSWGGYGLFTSAVALKIDLKLDDGKAFSGDAVAVSNSWNSGCGNTTNGTEGYNVNAGGRICDMGFLVGK